MRAPLLSVLAVAVLASRPPRRPTRRRPARRGRRPRSPSPTAPSSTPTCCGPSNLPADAKTPVIVSVGPYFNHSGQTGPLGPVEGTPYDPIGTAGPSDALLRLRQRRAS